MKQIFFKEGVDQREFTQLHPKLYSIIEYMSEEVWNLYRDFLVVTSIYRADSSTHKGPKPYRFIDFGILERGGIEGSEKLRTYINGLFPYDPARPEMETIVPLAHGTALHLHCQVF